MRKLLDLLRSWQVSVDDQTELSVDLLLVHFPRIAQHRLVVDLSNRRKLSEHLVLVGACFDSILDLLNPLLRKCLLFLLLLKGHEPLLLEDSVDLLLS